MLNQWISILCQTASGPVFGYAMELMQQIKPNNAARWMRIAFWTVIFFIIAIHKIFTNGSMAGTVIGWLMTGIFMVISFVCFYGGTIWRRIAVFFMLLVAMMTAECAFGLVCWLFQTDCLSLDFRQTDMMLGSLLGSMLSIVSMFFVAALWRRFEKESRLPRGSWAFVLLPLCLVIPSVYYYVEILQGNGEVALIHLVSMLAAFVLDLFLVCIQFNQAEKDELEKELQALRYRMQLEQQHYQNVEARREEMAKIRHDYNNLLTSVLGLLRSGKAKEAEQTMAALLSRVQETGEYQYCGIPIVNAILAVKQEECRKNEILLRTDLLFPEEMDVEQIDLCSAFSNLLDNAIHACMQLPPKKPRSIALSVGVRGDYLIIRCDNPAAKLPGETKSGGYGCRILEDIARRYDGNFQTEFGDDVFTARLILLAQSGFAKKR